jgi:hypothetical protein
MITCFSVAAKCRACSAWVLASCALVFATGCGPDYKARGVVRGKVTTGKKALTTGTVMFYGPNGITASASIRPDGTYEMPDAPLGECQVTVTVSGLPNDPSVRARLKGKGPAMPGGPVNPEDSGPPPPPLAEIPKEVVPIDTKYSNPETSGLKFTVKKGEQTYNIEL